MRLLWICLLLVIKGAFCAQVKLCHQSSYNLNSSVFELQESDKKLSIKEAWSYFNSNKFTSIATRHNELNKGFVSHVYWLAIPITNLQAKPETLEVGIANAGIYSLEYYLVSNSDSSVINQRFTGKSFDFFHRPIINRHYYFPLLLKPQSKSIIFYRVDICGNGFNTPLRLVTKNFRETSEANVYLSYAFFCGLLGFVSFFSLIAFYWTKDTIYLYYCAYVVCGTLFFLADGDLDYGWLYPHWPAWALIAPSMYGVAMVFFMLLFMSGFLHLKLSHPFLFKLLIITLFLLIILLLLIPISHSFLHNIFLRTFTYFYGVCVIILACLLQFFCILRRVQDKYQPAYLYGTAILSVLAAVFIYTIHSFNIFSVLFPSFNYILWGFLIEISILSIALLYSYNYNLRKYQEVSMRLANQQVEFTRQLLETQESEQKRIAEDLHDELGGNLAVIKMRLQSVQVTDKNSTSNLIDLIDKASANARFIAHNLMPPEFATTKMTDLLSTLR